MDYQPARPVVAMEVTRARVGRRDCFGPSRDSLATFRIVVGFGGWSCVVKVPATVCVRPMTPRGVPGPIRCILSVLALGFVHRATAATASADVRHVTVHRPEPGGYAGW